MTTDLAPHPAKWSKPLLPVVDGYLPLQGRILDPLAGVGTLSQLARPGRQFYFNELEPEWACQCPGPTTVGDARHLPYPDNTFDAEATSVVFGNRMSDHHNARERCKACDATGKVWGTDGGGPAGLLLDDCPKCDGVGRRQYKRHTYRHYIGRPLHPANAGQLKGTSPKYRDMHRAIYVECFRVLRPGREMVLNVSNYIAGEEVDMVSWHLAAMREAGFEWQVTHPVSTPRQRHGANRELRVAFEAVTVFRKPLASVGRVA